MGEPRNATVTLARHSLVLLPSGAIYGEAMSTLFVADVHLGKAATYRQLGQPVPIGTTSQTLAQLSQDLNTHRAKHLVVLGDFLHGPQAQRSRSTWQVVDQWRERHSHTAMTLIRGNHDDRAGDPPASLGMDVVDEPHEIAGLACCHDRQGLGRAPGMPVLWGHWHPVVVLQGRARERFRLPCFVVGANHLLLPAYGAFTGGHVYTPSQDEAVYVIADQSVFKLPGPASVRRQSPRGSDT